MSFRLTHLSDAHIGPLPRPLISELFGKRLTGFLNWHNGRYRIHDMAVLSVLVSDLRAQNAQHCAMTGDILNIGLRAEFPPAKAWLESLGAPDAVSFVPGNHDAYVRGNLPLIDEFFGPWMTSDHEAEARFPYVRLRGPVALIGVSSGVPTAPFMASGVLGKTQIAALAKILVSPLLKGMARVIMIHHPPYLGGARFGRGLNDAPAFQQVIRECGADLILHGHNHRASVHFLRGARNQVPVVGVASASAVPGSPRHLAAYHIYEIREDKHGWRVEGHKRGLKSGDRTVHDLGALNLRPPLQA